MVRLKSIMIVFLTMTFLFSSCIVSKKKYEEMERLKNKKIRALKDENKDKEAKIKSLDAKLDKTISEYNDVKNDLLASNAKKTSAIDSLNATIRNLTSDTSLLGEQLRKAISLYEEENEKITKLRKELEEKQKRLSELESMIDRNKAELNRLKNTISDALVAFDQNELTVKQKNGKVYVSLDEKLLFGSGSTKVDPKGVKALQELAVVLEKNPDIDIVIEGHTDNVGTPEYNWDLSVKRATSIVKILQEHSDIDPKRFMPTGRGMYLPIDTADTKEARQLNRRTEIILMPKLDILYEMLQEDVK
jgi:chemotaxis protein MotB